jgi:hypothetical protein
MEHEGEREREREREREGERETERETERDGGGRGAGWLQLFHFFFLSLLPLFLCEMQYLIEKAGV